VFYYFNCPGTRIVYERNFLMQLKNSPMAKTPPKNIQFIPGVTGGLSPIKQSGLCVDNNNVHNNKAKPASPARGT
jgi:eukaryotic translation initiation factor 4E binding protein 2